MIFVFVSRDRLISKFLLDSVVIKYIVCFDFVSNLIVVFKEIVVRCYLVNSVI